MRIEIIRINCFLSIFDRILMEFMNYGNVKDSMVHGIPIESLMLGVWFLYGFHGYLRNSGLIRIEGSSVWQTFLLNDLP